MLIDLLNSKVNMLKVIVTDGDTALMNDIATASLKTTALLCHFHIEKMLEQNASQTIELNLTMLKWMGNIRNP